MPIMLARCAMADLTITAEAAIFRAADGAAGVCRGVGQVDPAGKRRYHYICHFYFGGTPDPSPEEIEEIILAARKAGDSVGGAISCTVTGISAGFGAPVSAAMLRASLLSTCLRCLR